MERTFETPTQSSSSSTTTLQTLLDARRGLLRIDVEKAGADLAQRLSDVLAGTDADVVHLDLSMTDPDIDSAIAVARARGFFFAAMLPEYRPDDVLRLQLLLDAESAILPEAFATEGGQRLCHEIRRDWMSLQAQA